MHCKECGSLLKEGFKQRNTRLYVCEVCFTEKAEFVIEKCDHEYADKNGNKCIHCGEPNIYSE